MIIIDWSEMDEYPECICYCKCGRIYQSHTKLKGVGPKLILVSRKPCPGCGENMNNLTKVSGEKEIIRIEKKDQGSI